MEITSTVRNLAVDPRTQKIDDLRDAFKKGWQADRPPLLEEVVRSADESLREELFRELLAVEWECRTKAGRPLTISAARKRFAPRTVASAPTRMISIRLVMMAILSSKQTIRKFGRT